ncbi:MAG: single-stranded DNA-binding protein [bacterium]
MADLRLGTLNRVFLIGRLTRDPDLRFIPSGTAVVNFGIAVNRLYKTTSGEKKEEVCYVNIVAWKKLAELCGEHLKMGSPVLVEGRLQSKSWETKDGQKRSNLEVVADKIEFLGRLSQSMSGDNDFVDSVKEDIDDSKNNDGEVPF